MIKRIGILCLLFAVIAPAPVYASTAVIAGSGSGAYKSARLTPEIYNNADKYLTSLRLKDEDGNDVPYCLNSVASETKSSSEKKYRLSLENSYIRGSSAIFEFSLGPEDLKKISGGEIINATSINFHPAGGANFAKTANLYGSLDGNTWRLIKNSLSLYRVDGAPDLGYNSKAGAVENLEITFTRPEKYTIYILELLLDVPSPAGQPRFGAAAPLPEVSFDSAVLFFREAAFEREYFEREFSPPFTLSEDSGDTIVTLPGTRHLRVKSVTIDTDSVFQREVISGASRQTLYNFNWGGENPVSSLTFLPAAQPLDDDMTLRIINGSDRPIAIKGVSVAYYADEIIFPGGGGGAYTLYFYGSPTSAPVYDIASYKDKLIKNGLDELYIDNITIDETTQGARDYSALFNIAVFAAAALLLAVLLVKLKRAS
ncbi:MAG: hypothetical protein LBU36_04020 [Clostridiales bacterium]|jgi:hypothetical protein|nr:hypothetical protein [Clostridiales bacterium]